MRQLLIAAILIAFLTACAPKQSGVLSPERLRDIACRLVEVVREPAITIKPLIDVNLNTVSSDRSERTFEAGIHGSRKLGARIDHVQAALPFDRFNVTMLLDGIMLLRINHVDLDIYLETVVDQRVYALHCFPELSANRE